MSKKIRWGILSTANIGKARVIPAIQQSRNGVVSAVASRDTERAQSFARELGIPRAYGSYEELIADPEIDAIYNPLPNSEHAEWSIKCAEAGKPTLCEKPLASDAEDAQRMVDAFKDLDVLFAEAFMYRFHPQSQRVQQMIADGAVGRLHSIQAAFAFQVSKESNIRLSKALAGGSLMDVGCYCVNVMRFMTGEEPDEVHGFAEMTARSDVEESFAGILRFPSGVLGHFDSSLRSAFAHSYELRGSEGRLLVEQAFVPSPQTSSIIRHWHGSDYQEIEIPAANSYTLMAEDFADALIDQRAPKFAPEDAVANMRVLDRLYAAAGIHR